MEETEIWMPVIGYESFYEVSNIGRVKSLIRGSGNHRNTKEKILKPYEASGYYEVSLYIDKSKVHGKIHRLMARAFIPNPEKKRCINHKNGIKTDNRLSNVEWATHTENLVHAYQTGLHKPRPGVIVRQRHSDEEIILAKKLINEGHRLVDIAKMHKLSLNILSNISQGRSWKSL